MSPTVVRPWTVSRRIAGLLAALMTWSSCAPAAGPGGQAGPPPPSRREAPSLELSRSGTLRQDEISVRLRTGALRIEVTPLLPWVLEAAAPDTRSRLERIADTHLQELVRSSGRAEVTMMLVSFSSSQPATEFRPEDLHVVARGLRERPIAIRPVTPSWGSRRLEQQTVATAVYAFPGGLDLTREMTVEYGGASDSSWSSIVPRIEAERGRVSGPGGGQSSSPNFLIFR